MSTNGFIRNIVCIVFPKVIIWFELSNMFLLKNIVKKFSSIHGLCSKVLLYSDTVSDC